MHFLAHRSGVASIISSIEEIIISIIIIIGIAQLLTSDKIYVIMLICVGLMLETQDLFLIIAILKIIIEKINKNL